MQGRSKTATAESAWRLADDLMQSAPGQLNPPHVDTFVGEYCKKYGVSLWQARAAVYRAAERAKIDPVWYDCHTRLIPASLPGTDAAPAGGVEDDDVRESPWYCGRWSMDALERDAPDLAAALINKHAEEAVFPRVEDFVECARFWDAVVMMQEHGLDATTTHAGSVCCRECGDAVSVGVANHLSIHNMAIDAYRAKHPAAPATIEEAAALPPASFDW